MLSFKVNSVFLKFYTAYNTDEIGQQSIGLYSLLCVISVIYQCLKCISPAVLYASELVRMDLHVICTNNQESMSSCILGELLAVATGNGLGLANEDQIMR